MKPARKTLRRPDELVAAGLIAHERHGEIEAVAARYALALTAEVAELIDPADPRDPIARQFVPAAAELDARPEEMADPIGDDAHSPLEGIVHRYPDRVLLKPVHVCAAYCRFCFRREVVGRARALSRAQLDAAMTYIRAHSQIWEVILTGGDPLVLSSRRLGQIVDMLAAIDHVKVIRVHTRVPVVAPARVTAALGELMRALVECRIKPYYLHHGDLAPGTAQWRTGIEEGQALMRALHGRLSGLCQPTYVLDIPGGHGKSPIGPNYLSEDGGEIEDFRGGRHRYEPR